MEPNDRPEDGPGGKAEEGMAAANAIDPGGFERVAAAIAADPGEYNQRWEYVADGIEGCGSACCVMGHAALIAGKRERLAATRIEQLQNELACAELGLVPDSKEAWRLFGFTWPAWWFVRSGAATAKQLGAQARRGEQRGPDGTLERTIPNAREAVLVLRWIGKLGYMPATDDT